MTIKLRKPVPISILFNIPQEKKTNWFKPAYRSIAWTSSVGLRSTVAIINLTYCSYNVAGDLADEMSSNPTGAVHLNCDVRLCDPRDLLSFSKSPA